MTTQRMSEAELAMAERLGSELDIQVLADRIREQRANAGVFLSREQAFAMAMAEPEGAAAYERYRLASQRAQLRTPSVAKAQTATVQMQTFAEENRRLGLSRDKAMTRAIADHPAVYEQYLAEMGRTPANDLRGNTALQDTDAIAARASQPLPVMKTRAEAQLEGIARGYMANNASLTYEAAYALAIQTNGSLYEEFRAEKRAQQPTPNM